LIIRAAPDARLLETWQAGTSHDLVLTSRACAPCSSG